MLRKLFAKRCRTGRKTLFKTRRWERIGKEKEGDEGEEERKEEEERLRFFCHNLRAILSGNRNRETWPQRGWNTSLFHLLLVPPMFPNLSMEFQSIS